MTVEIGHSYLEQGTSDELYDAFACLAEATAVDGTPRYSKKTLSDLRVSVVCRTYATPTFELCHFVAALGVNNCAYVESLWTIAHPTRLGFKSHLQAGACGSSFAEAGPNGVTLNFADGAFTISYGRMPFLNAFLEFLFTALGFDTVDELLRPLGRIPMTSDNFNSTANGLQRAIYSFLQDHLPPVQQQRKFRSFLTHVEKTAEGKQGIDAVDDDAVLSFWREAAFDTASDVVTFESAYRIAWQLILALEAAQERNNLASASSIGTNRDAGEVEPEDIAAVAMSLFQESIPVERIAEAVDAGVRLASERELNILRGLPLEERVERRLPLSMVRNATHGFTQRRITAALRRNAIDLEAILVDEENIDYRTFMSALEDICCAFEALALAALWALHQAERPTSIEIAMRIAPDINWGELMAVTDEDAPVVSFTAHTAATKFYEADVTDRGDEFSALLREAKAGWSKTNRAGFKDMEDDDCLDVMESAVPAALDISERLRKWLGQQRQRVDWDAIEQSDNKLFHDVFRRLYHMTNAERGYGD